MVTAPKSIKAMNHEPCPKRAALSVAQPNAREAIAMSLGISPIKPRSAPFSPLITGRRAIYETQ